MNTFVACWIGRFLKSLIFDYYIPVELIDVLFINENQTKRILQILSVFLDVPDDSPMLSREKSASRESSRNLKRLNEVTDHKTPSEKDRFDKASEGPTPKKLSRRTSEPLQMLSIRHDSTWNPTFDEIEVVRRFRSDRPHFAESVSRII